MEINRSNIKYIEWRTTEDLHEDIVNCISELRFIRDEQQFLEDLIRSYTMDLLGGDLYEKSKEVIGKLSDSRKALTPLQRKLIAHNNNLEVLLDENDIPCEIEDYKEDHYQLMFEVASYYSKFKKVKRRIFNLIKKIMKDAKQKRLLN
jgi:hypothetical protein